MAEQMSFSRWLKRLRAEQDLTQEMLAEQVGCATTTLRSFEIGKRRPSRDMAERIAEVLKVPAEQLPEFLRLARLPVERDTDVADENTPANEEGTVVVSPVSSAALPQPINPLIGREAERNALRTLLIDERSKLVTIVGAGGMGKTRLALDAAMTLGKEFGDGATFVSLASLQSANSIPFTLAESLNISLQGVSDVRHHLIAQLRTRSLLLVLDNFEHLLPEPDAIICIKELIQSAPQVQLLVTSRERLRISGERTFELSGLALPSATQTAFMPDDQSDALIFFLERAQHADSSFVLDSSNRSAIVRICQLLDGMPLGIELAAAWVRVLSPQEIADELTRNLDFLALADRDANPRHQSMRAIFDYSWHLLTSEEREVLMRLSIFRGGCTRQAVAQIAGASLPILASLLDKSLLYRETVGNQARYYMHQLISQYAAEHLQHSSSKTFPSSEADLEERFANYYLNLAGEIHPSLYSDDILHWQKQIHIEQDNLRSILQRSLVERRNPAVGQRLAAILGRYWCTAENWKEGRDWLEKALALGDNNASVEWRILKAQLLTPLGELYHLLGDQPKAEQLLIEAVQLWRATNDQQMIAWSLLQLGKAYATHGSYTEADDYLTESLALYRQLNHTGRIGTLLNQLSAVAIQQGDYVRAEALLNESLPDIRTDNRSRPLAIALNFLGRSILGQGDAARSVPLFNEALSLFEKENSESGIAWSLINLGLAQRALGNWAEAIFHYRRCFQVYQHLEQIGGMMAACEGLASALSGNGEFEKSVLLLAAAEKLRRQSSQVLTQYEMEIQQETFERTKAALTADVWERTWFAGQNLSTAQISTTIATL